MFPLYGVPQIYCKRIFHSNHSNYGGPSEEDVTDGKMTLGFDISNDLKDERWSAHPQRFTAVARCCGRLKMVI